MTPEELTQAELPFTSLSANRRRTVDLLPFARRMATATSVDIDEESLSAILSVAGVSEVAGSQWALIRASARAAAPVVNVDNRLAYIISALAFRRHEFGPAVSLVGLLTSPPTWHLCHEI